MIAMHPLYLVDAGGVATAVQLPVTEYRGLVLAAFAAGRMGIGEAPESLGLTRPEFHALAHGAGISTCTYTRASVEAELANI